MTAHPPGHLSTPSLAQSLSQPLLKYACFHMGTCRETSAVARLRDSLYNVHDLELLCLQLLICDTSLQRVLRVAKPFSADALKRKEERRGEGKQAKKRVGRFMVEEHVNGRSHIACHARQT